MDYTEKDMPEALSVLKDIKKSSRECLQHVQALIAKVKNGPSLKEGISLLEVKNQLMSSYMSSLTFLMDRKCSGHSVRGDPAIDRLVEMRTVLEKMRPMEHKLRYQINKVVAAYKEGKLDPSDPRKFRPNFSAFSNISEQNSSDEEDVQSTGEAKDKQKLYTAPKLAPVHYSDDETAEERQKKVQEKNTKRALSSSMLKEMREQFTDAPTEITESADMHRFHDNKRRREKSEYEEDNFVRLPMTKKESAGMRKMGTVSALGALADFGDWDGNAKGEPAKKKKKGKITTKRKGKGFGKKGGRKGKR